MNRICYISMMIGAAFQMVAVWLLMQLVSRDVGGVIYKSICGLGCVPCFALAFISYDVIRMNPAASHTIRSLLSQYAIIKLCFLFAPRWLKQLKIDAKTVRKIQDSLLMNIIKTNSQSEIGRLHHFVSIQSREEFVKRHPLTTYADIDEYIERMCEGEENVLTSEKVVYFAMTSGTTGKNKRFPITNSYKSGFMKYAGLSFYSTMLYANYPCCLGRTNTIRTKPTRYRSSAGIDMGSLTSFIGGPPINNVTPGSVYDIPAEDAGLYGYALFSLGERELVMIEGFMSPLTLSFFKVIEDHADRLCHDISNGTVSDKMGIPETVRADLEEHLKADPERADVVAQEVAKGRDGLAMRLWPRLQFLSMLSTGAFAYAGNMLKETYMLGVNTGNFFHLASEGELGHMVCDGNPARQAGQYTPSLYTTFIEFIPEEEVHEEQPSTLFMDQVQLGGSYEMVVTTMNGLYRHRMGDIIKVVDFNDQIPLYEIQSRLGQLLNVCYEKTPENLFMAAMERTEQRLKNTDLIEYTSVENVIMQPITGEHERSKHYLLFIEVEFQGQTRVLNDTERTWPDEELCNVFENYRAYRKKGTIDAMQVIQVEQGTFKEMKKMISKTTGYQQYKSPRVMRNKDILEMLYQRRLHTADVKPIITNI